MKLRRAGPPSNPRGLFLFLLGSLSLLTIALPAPSGAHGRKPPAIIREADFSDKTFLSLDDVTLAVGGQMTETPGAQGAELSFRSHKVLFTVASSTAIVDGQEVALATAPVRDSRSMWVPR